MSQHPLARAMRDFARAKCQRPENAYTAEEAAAQWAKRGPCSVDKARGMLKEMVRAGIMVEINGSRQTAQGQIVPCAYFRPATKGKK